MMDADEKEIFRYLKGQLGVFVNTNAISRHAGGKHKFKDSHDWARPALMRMKERGILEVDASGAYGLKPIPLKSADKPRWVSPQIAALLLKSGKQIQGVGYQGDDDEVYYDSL